ncbi:variant surface glycoprotein (VSG), putative [Trypanosoma equiperdum]|uniref:Variant surface glycoprotein (VSG), putative n=1 Tax=Trypanosoma equiperdum TaxID=5694 RepID=A0A1G4IDG8_TRYEQ|nr:variant surface glycoprotein (VSG), putative [Trypanosoma equiperdum]
MQVKLSGSWLAAATAATLAVTLLCGVRQGAPAANDNAKPFNLMCGILQILTAEPSLPTTEPTENIADDIRQMLQLNLTTAEDSMFDQNFELGEEDSKNNGENKNNRAAWQEAKKLITKGDYKIEGVKLQRPGPSHARAVANQVINRTLKVAMGLKSQLKEMPTPADIKKELAKVLYGETGIEDSAGTSTYGANGNTVCGGGSAASSGAGKTFMSDLVCLCAQSGGNSPDCTGTALSNVVYDTTGNAAQAAGVLKTQCPSTADHKTSGENLRTAKAMFFAALKASATGTATNKNLLGKGDESTCNGQGNGNCVLYKPTSPQGTLEIAWLNRLDGVIQKFETATAAAATNNKIAAQIGALKAAAIGEYLKALAGDAKVIGPAAEKSGQVENSKAKGVECVEAKSSEEKCKTLKNKGCTFNAAKKTCELREDVKAELEKENQAGTDGKDKKADSKCAGKEQKDCEKATECKWENNACKDSSILVNKQFALSVVSAAFIALLFYFYSTLRIYAQFNQIYKICCFESFC